MPALLKKEVETDLYSNVKKKMLESIKGNNKDTHFLGEKNNVKCDTLRPSKQTFFDMLVTRRNKVEMREIGERIIVQERKRGKQEHEKQSAEEKKDLDGKGGWPFLQVSQC